jgi:outer membrane beta-barrel protein
MKSKILSIFLLSSLFFSSKIIAAEKDIYEFSWLDPDKEVYVLQNRKFRKAERLYVNAGAGITTSGAFVDSTSIQGRAGLFLTEGFGIEGIFAKNSGKENSAAVAVRSQNGGSARPFRRIVDNYWGAMATWSPFYSKTNTFNSIIYMDWIFGVGYAQLNETNNKLDFVNDTSLEGIPTKESHSGLIWEAGLMFYLNQNFTLRTDLTAIHYSAANVKSAGSSIKSNYDATVSLGFTF